MSLREHGIIHLKVDNNPGPEPKQTKESAEWHRQWMRQLRESAREMEAQEAAETKKTTAPVRYRPARDAEEDSRPRKTGYSRNDVVLGSGYRALQDPHGS
jgi:hypothetical protein